MRQDSPRVSAVILNHNGRSLLEVVLPSLRRQTYEDFAVTVVDDASSDDSLAYLEEHWPEVHVAPTDRNIGVAAAMNLGVRSTTGEFVALLNNDIELHPDWLAELVRVFDEHPDAASASGKMLRFADRRVIDGAGDALDWRGTAERRGGGEPDHGQFDTGQEVFSACAGAALYRRSALAAVGTFDEDFFAYVEDVDWGFRSQLAGYRCRYQPSALVYHMGSATTGRNDAFFEHLRQRNTLFLAVKNYPLQSLLRHGHRVLVLHAYWLVQNLWTYPPADEIARARATARLIPAMLAKRRRIQRGRRVSPAYLEAVIDPSPRLRSPGQALRAALRAARADRAGR